MKKIRFQKRLLFCVFTLLAVLILLGASAFCAFAMYNAHTTEQSTMEQIAERISLQVDGVYRQMGIAATATVTNPSLRSIVFELNTNPELSSYDKLQYGAEITSNMTTNLFYLADAQNAFLYNANKQYYYCTGLYLWDEEAVSAHAHDLSAYNRLLDTCPDTYILQPPHSNPWKPEADPVISVVKRFWDNDRVENAIFEVQLPYSLLEDTCWQESFSDNKQILIFDENGSLIFPYRALSFVVSQDTLRQIEADISEGKTSHVGTDYLFATHTSDYTNWQTVLIGNSSLLQRQLVQYAVVTLFFILLLGFSTLMVLTILTRRLTRPLNNLVEKVHDVSLEKLNLDFGNQTPDELASLDESFQAMFQKLHDSVQEVYETRIRETNAHLHALQSQINPHFLYNTLNSIGAAAQIYGVETATKMCQSLANMMRYITSKQDKNRLIDEMTHTENYLSLCQIPYGDTFHYSINIPPEMYNLTIPKLTIQPLVENAISHGFESSDPPFAVFINGSIRNDGRWCLVVTDNGCGFSEDKIAELNEFVAQYKREGNTALDTTSLDIGGLGLKNIFARLLIIFNGNVDFSVVNNTVGCSVMILGPCPEKDEQL